MAKTGAIAKLKAMAKDRPSYDAKALKELVASGGDVPSNYKGREHVWAKKVKKFAEGGKVEDKAYIGYRRAGRRPESQQNREASANIPVAVARGLVSGTLGLPGDIESLARMPYELITGKESKTILPTSEDIEKRLPFRGASQTPVGQMFTGAGQLAGGAYTGPLSGARAVMAVPRGVARAGRDFVQAAGQNVSPLTVYHGSPHKFEKFDSSKIGTGEGAQSYGHGLYFAESPEVAKGYQSRLSSDRGFSYRGKTGLTRAEVQDLVNAEFGSGYLDGVTRPSGVADSIIDDMVLGTQRKPGQLPRQYKEGSERAELYKRLKNEIHHADPGSLYTVDLPDEKIARMLDWDKPLSEQESVKAALNAINKEIALPRLQDAEGAGFAYQHLANAVGGPQNAAALLREAGIPGIKYLDEQSRGATGKGKWKITMKNGEQKIYDFKPNDDVLEQMGATAEPAGTRNFVVFPGEEDALTILERKKEGGEVKMAEGGAAFGRYTTGRKYQGAVKRAKEADVNKLPDPRTYAFVSGLLGSAPDQLGFSVMHPDYKGIQRAGERGFVGGTILGVAPVVAPLTRGLPVGAAIKPVGGNWLTGSVENALGSLKRQTAGRSNPAEVLRQMHERYPPEWISQMQEGGRRVVLDSIATLEKDVAINNWIDRNLTNYIKKQMATPDDPVRLAIEKRQVEVEGKFARDQQRAQRVADRAAAETDPMRQANLSRQAQQMFDEANVERDIGMSHLSHLPSGFGENYVPRRWLGESRERVGFPAEGMGKTPSSKIWENLSDESTGGGRTIKELGTEDRKLIPDIDKVGPDEKFYYFSEGWGKELGLDHIVDVLKQDLNAGRIAPDQLGKISMEQAVRRTAEFDQEMAKKMREAQIKATEGMPVHKEYPEGYRWIELALPKENAKRLSEIDTLLNANRQGGEYGVDWLRGANGEKEYFVTKVSGRNTVYMEKFPTEEEAIARGKELSGQQVDVDALMAERESLTKETREKMLEDALKYEGDTMGHCVGGYCPDVLEGRSRIYSLRDAKGEPHVTIEVAPERSSYVPDKNNPNLGELTGAERIVQIKGKQNRAPKEEYLPFVQDFVRSGQWSGVGDLPNTGMFKIESGPRATEFDRAAFERYGNYATTQELDDLERMLKAQQPEGMKAGGAVGCGCNDEPKMQAGGAIKTLKNLLGGGAKAEDAATAAQRAAAGRMAADVAKATQPMKMSEALGNLNVEGKGKVKVTQSDRTRVGGGNIGGAMFPGLSQVDPFYQDLVWGVGKKSTGSGLINQSDDLTYWSTLLGSEDQLKSNPIVFNKLRAGFVDAMKQGKLSKELEDKINKNLSVTFGEGANIRDPKIWQKADTFERRTALADVMLGQGLPPNKGGVPLGGEKSGKGVIFKPTDILKRETEPLLLHPEHGGDVPTFAVGPRLFQFSGGMKVRPDLHPGFPFLLEGQDMGMVFRPAPGEIAMRDFNQRMLTERGRKPGYYEWTMGEKGKGLPSQLITDEYLTYLQKQGYAEGGKVKSGLSALEKV